MKKKLNDEIQKRVIKLHKEGLALTVIASRLGISRQSVRRALDLPVLKSPYQGVQNAEQ